MAKDTPTDPTEAFREMVTQWERGFDAFANNLMGTEGFSKSMNRVQDVRLGARNAFSEFMADQLSTFNMPTRDDVIRLAEAVQALDKRMAHVETLLEQSLPAEAKLRTAPRKGPPRTKLPPSAGIEKGAAGGNPAEDIVEEGKSGKAKKKA